MANYSFNDWQYAEFRRRGGHMEIYVTGFVDGTDTADIRLIFDTGAFITVLSKETAKKIKLPLGTGKPALLQGFTNEHEPVAGELIEIPRIMLGRHFVYDVKVIVPSDEIAISEVLGENVLEYFNYVIDHEKNLIYFKKNPAPKPYINADRGIDLSCGKVLLADSCSRMNTAP